MERKFIGSHTSKCLATDDEDNSYYDDAWIKAYYKTRRKGFYKIAAIPRITHQSEHREVAEINGESQTTIISFLRKFLSLSVHNWTSMNLTKFTFFHHINLPSVKIIKAGDRIPGHGKLSVQHWTLVIKGIWGEYTSGNFPPGEFNSMRSQIVSPAISNFFKNKIK